MERMGALDSAFLQLEDRNASLSIGSVAVFEGPQPSFTEMRAALTRKLPRVPRYRQRLCPVPLDIARPVWVDDPEFDVNHHLHRAALPSPGGDRELEELVGHVMSLPLERHRPLWEAWFVGGLEGGCWALITKVHHSMVDGIAGMAILSRMLDTNIDEEPAPDDEWSPAALPGPRQLIADAVRERLADPYLGVSAGLRLVRSPRQLVASAGATARGVLGYAAAIRPVTASTLNGPIGPDRRYRWAAVPITDLQKVRDAFGGTLNDVVLAAITHAFRQLLLRREDTPDRHKVRTLVPVSVRHADDRGRADNHVSAILLDLPVEEQDPVAQLRTVSRRMDRAKSSHEADAGEAVTQLAALAPPSGLAAGLHLAFRVPQRVLTTVTTNVPGPRSKLHLAGRRMIANYPYVPIADRVRVGIAVTSYDGMLLFGITGDWASTPDIGVLRDALVEGLGDLVKASEDVAREPLE